MILDNLCVSGFLASILSVSVYIRPVSCGLISPFQASSALEMAQQYVADDPNAPTVVWRFRDLPELADECIEHGLNEMMLWGWQPWDIPSDAWPQLGTKEEVQQALDACRAKGVNVSFFVSVDSSSSSLP